jgi:hypothetical protein
MNALQGSVGEKGQNKSSDVETVQRALNLAGFTVGRADGRCGPKTINGIKSCQQKQGAAVTGLLAPADPVWGALNRTADLKAAELEREWGGDSAKWPEERKLASMEPGLRAKVRLILSTLVQSGFQPKVFYGWRSVAVQERLFAEGRSKVRFSFHNAQKPDGTPHAYAADIVDKRWGWNDDAEKHGFWKALGKAANASGLVWGGDWNSFPDVAHVQSRQNSELAATKEESAL